MRDYAETEEGKIYLDLRNKCLNEINIVIKYNSNTEEAIYNKIIAIIRKYNREWNTICDNNKNLKKDGFVKVIKDQMMKMNFTGILKSFLKYL